jgi:hypothetical protein
MSGRRAVAGVLVCLGAAGALASLGCGKPSQKQVGPIKQWIIGEWVRTDDGIGWNFSADHQMISGGRLPVGGSYSTEEPNKVRVLITGANAHTSAIQLGLKCDDSENQNLTINFIVTDDEMKLAGIKSDVVFRKLSPP